jgi:hypothetical protein
MSLVDVLTHYGVKKMTAKVELLGVIQILTMRSLSRFVKFSTVTGMFQHLTV